MDRWRETEARTFDLIVVGGGIIGAGIARDASLRGLDVALFERADYGGGTTAGSTRLIHGGLRYLEMLDFRLVRMDLREREILLRIAPHLVKPLEFLVPFYERSLFYRLRLRLGMILYDLLSFDKTLPRHRFLSADEVRESEPFLRHEGLRSAALYYDAQVASPERLCVENILDARASGAACLNYAEVTALLRTGEQVRGVRVRDRLDGSEREIRGRLVMNASGPWLDHLSRSFAPDWQSRLRTTKGIHILGPARTRRAVVLFSKIDGRLFFVIPLLGHSWIGTTDTDYREDPGEARADDEDVRYLVESAGAYVPCVASDPIFLTNAGVRALVMERGDESSVSRMHRIQDGRDAGMPGLISVLGGKITGYRAIAEEATDLVCRRLGIDHPCTTATVPLPGGRGATETLPPNGGLRPDTLSHLRTLYGTRASQVLHLASSNEALRAPLAPDCPDIGAQVAFAVRKEQCVHATDFLLRRSLLAFTPDQGRSAFPAVVSLMARELGWPQAREDEEAERYARWLRMTQAGGRRMELENEPVS